MSHRLRVLFVCAMNRKRSLTAEQIFRNDARLEVRSAGVRREARRRVAEKDLLWADLIFVMERSHQRRIEEAYPELTMPQIEILDVPDDFEFMDPALVEMLRASVEPEIAARLGGGS